MLVEAERHLLPMGELRTQVRDGALELRPARHKERAAMQAREFFKERDPPVRVMLGKLVLFFGGELPDFLVVPGRKLLLLRAPRVVSSAEISLLRVDLPAGHHLPQVEVVDLVVAGHGVLADIILVDPSDLSHDARGHRARELRAPGCTRWFPLSKCKAHHALRPAAAPSSSR